MRESDPSEERQLELYATLAETIASLPNPTEFDVQRVLESLRTGDAEFDREMSESADILLVLAQHKPYFLKALMQDRLPRDVSPDLGPIGGD